MLSLLSTGRSKNWVKAIYYNNMKTSLKIWTQCLLIKMNIKADILVNKKKKICRILPDKIIFILTNPNYWICNLNNFTKIKINKIRLIAFKKHMISTYYLTKLLIIKVFKIFKVKKEFWHFSHLNLDQNCLAWLLILHKRVKDK